jgi:hypothetical protein
VWRWENWKRSGSGERGYIPPRPRIVVNASGRVSVMDACRQSIRIASIRNYLDSK